jgi:hypothetical protein
LSNTFTTYMRLCFHSSADISSFYPPAPPFPLSFSIQAGPTPRPPSRANTPAPDKSIKVSKRASRLSIFGLEGLAKRLAPAALEDRFVDEEKYGSGSGIDNRSGINITSDGEAINSSVIDISRSNARDTSRQQCSKRSGGIFEGGDLGDGLGITPV